MTCSIPCEFELIEHTKTLQGILGPDEQVCRFAYNMHFEKNKKLSRSVIRMSDLEAGELSVWRISIKNNKLDLKKLVKKGRNLVKKIGENGEDLVAIYARNVTDFQEERDQNSERIFCIIDNPICDEDSNTHPNHCLIRLCKVQLKIAEEVGKDHLIKSSCILSQFSSNK